MMQRAAQLGERHDQAGVEFDRPSQQTFCAQRLVQPEFGNTGNHMAARIVGIGEDCFLRQSPEAANILFRSTMEPQIADFQPRFLNQHFGGGWAQGFGLIE